MLEPGRISTLTWSIGGECTGEISLAAQANGMRLLYSPTTFDSEDFPPIPFWRSVSPSRRWRAAPQHAMAKIRRMGALCRDLGAGGRPSSAEAVTQLYRLRLITADPLSLRNRTVCDLPCKTTLITPEIPYSLL